MILRKRMGAVPAILMAGAFIMPTAAVAQRNPKPSRTNPECVQETYSLVANGAIGPWQTADAALADSTGYDPGAAQTTCGYAMNSQPLKCVDTKGTEAAVPDKCLGQAMTDYDSANPGRSAKVSTTSPLTYYSVAQRNLGSCQTAIIRGVWRSTPQATPAGCGAVTIPVTVECVSYETGALLSESLCSETRPPFTMAGEDNSACPTPAPSPPPPEPVIEEPVQRPQAVQIKLGTCNYTSSGGGRYACGDYANYRPGPKAPSPRELCTGSFLAGSEGQGNYDDRYSTSSAGVLWVVEPVVDTTIPAQCIVHWRSGYSDNGRTANWYSAYYSGPPSGIAGGLFIGKKP